MSEVADISDIVVGALRQPVMIGAPEERTFVALPTEGGGYKLENITSPHKATVLMPQHVTQAVKIQTAATMADYVNSFKNDGTKLFADIATDTITAIIDYHREPDLASAEKRGGLHDAEVAHRKLKDTPTPELGKHTATLKLPKSVEWAIWTGADGKLMRHVDFASFLEENAIDITEPSGASLLEVCRDLQVRANMNFNSTIRNGDTVKIEFQKGDEVNTKDDMELPNEFTITIPVYFGEPAVQIKAFVRRKVDDGKLELGFKLARVEAARQAEFHRVVNEMVQQVNHLGMFYGIPA